MSHHAHGGCGGSTRPIKITFYNGIVYLLLARRLWIHSCDSIYDISTLLTKNAINKGGLIGLDL
jgi:hypothetical protein